MVCKKLLVLCCTTLTTIICGMDYKYKEKHVVDCGSYVAINKQNEKQKVVFATLERESSKPMSVHIENSTALASKSHATSSTLCEHARIERKKIEQAEIASSAKETGAQCLAKPLVEQAEMIIDLHSSLSTKIEELAELKQTYSCYMASSNGQRYGNVELERQIEDQEHSIKLLQKKMDECITSFDTTVKSQLARCQDNEAIKAYIKTIGQLYSKFKQDEAFWKPAVICQKGLSACLDRMLPNLEITHIRSIQQTSDCDTAKLDKNIDAYIQHFTELSFEQKLAEFTNLIALHNDHENIIESMPYIADIKEKIGDTTHVAQLHQDIELHKMGLMVTVIKINRAITLLNTDIQKCSQLCVRGQYTALLTKTIEALEQQRTNAHILEKLKDVEQFLKVLNNLKQKK